MTGLCFYWIIFIKLCIVWQYWRVAKELWMWTWCDPGYLLSQLDLDRLRYDLSDTNLHFTSALHILSLFYVEVHLVMRVLGQNAPTCTVIAHMAYTELVLLQLSGKIKLSPRYEGQLNYMAEPIPPPSPPPPYALTTIEHHHFAADGRQRPIVSIFTDTDTACAPFQRSLRPGSASCRGELPPAR